MRLALVHKRFDHVGGAEWDCYEMSRQLAARGHDVHVVVGECRAAVPAGVTVHRVPVLRVGQTAKLLSFAALAPRVWRRIDADCVVGFGRTVGHDLFRASGGCHLRYLAQRADGGWRARGRALSPYQRAMLAVERRQYAPGGYRKILSVSDHARAEILDTYRVPPEDVAVLRYGIDVQRFARTAQAVDAAALRRELGVAVDRPVVLLVGTGFERKGVETLLGIWRRQPPAGATLVVVGDDRHLESWRRGAPEYVTFTGPRRDVERLYAAADLFVLPSTFDAFGIVVLEALAAGLPVVTSRAIGAAEVLVGPLAELVVDDPRDGGAIAAAVARGLDPDRRPALKRAARDAAEGADLERAVAALERWCGRVATAKRSRVPAEARAILAAEDGH